MKAIVLAGGLGTRLRARVPDLPKPMASIAGRPFLEFVLDRLVTGGIEGIILSIGYHAELIQRHFGQSYKNIPIQYAVELEPLGTGGAILHALSTEGNDPILVLNGDTLLDVDYSDLMRWYCQEPTKAAIVLRMLPDVTRYGSIVLSDDRVMGFLEKGKSGAGLINAGVYIIKPQIFHELALQGRFSFETDVLQSHCTLLSPRAFVTDAYFIDIGIPEDYDRAQIEFLSFS